MRQSNTIFSRANITTFVAKTWQFCGNRIQKNQKVAKLWQLYWETIGRSGNENASGRRT